MKTLILLFLLSSCSESFNEQRLKQLEAGIVEVELKFKNIELKCASLNQALKNAHSSIEASQRLQALLSHHFTKYCVKKLGKGAVANGCNCYRNNNGVETYFKIEECVPSFYFHYN